MVTIHDIETLQLDLEERETHYLVSNGWTSSSATPTHRVLWAHEWRGHVIMVSRNLAVEFQGAIDRGAT
jgi:hypothetical protein